MQLVAWQEYIVLMLIFPLGLSSAYFLWKRGLFHLSKQRRSTAITLQQVVALFAIYLSVVLVVFPAAIAFFVGSDALETLNDGERGWLETGAVVLSFVVVMGAYLMINSRQPLNLWGGFRSCFQNLLLGIACLPIAYSVVILLTSLIEQVMRQFMVLPTDVNQVAVDYFVRALQQPWLTVASIAAIVVVVPLQEELLFRGFFQSWLRSFMGAKAAIVGASLLFTLFHFSYLQGVMNVPLLSALFALSMLLGTLYEKQGSLWASVGLHASFNAFSILLISFASGLS